MKFGHSDDNWIKCTQCDSKVRNNKAYRQHFLSRHLKVSLKPFYCVQCSNVYTREKDCWIHIAMKHEGISIEWSSLTDWKRLRKEKPQLVGKRNVAEEETNLLKGHIDDKYLTDTKGHPSRRH